ncbi:hypothetical protein Tco_0287462 [Tanacetum coccineum]
MGTMRDTLTEGGEGALHLGPKRARVFADLLAEQKDRYKTDIRAMNILLQVDAYLKQNEVMLIITKYDGRGSFNQLMTFALLSNASFRSIHTTTESPQSSNQPSIADNFQLDTGSTSTDNLIESLTNTLALLNQSFKAHLPQMNNQLRTPSNRKKKNERMLQSRRQSILFMNVREQKMAIESGSSYTYMC